VNTRIFPSTGDVFTGTVVEVKPFGSFVEHPGGAHGLLHQETLEVGAEVRVRVLQSDPEQRRFSLARA
jgi:polyribonucleotide nucleotidyltransferase